MNRADVAKTRSLCDGFGDEFNFELLAVGLFVMKVGDSKGVAVV